MNDKGGVSPLEVAIFLALWFSMIAGAVISMVV